MIWIKRIKEFYPMPVQPIDFIGKSEFFSGLSPDNKKALADLCLLKRLAKNEALFQEGAKGHSLFLLAIGAVQLHKTSEIGKDVVIRVIKPGEIFAEVILFEEDLYPVSALALKDSTVIMLPKHQINCLLEKPSFRNDFIRMLMRKMRYLADQIRGLSSEDVEERFFRFLRTQFGDRREYTVSLSKKDMAAAIGTLPETFSRLLNRLKKEGKAEWAAGVIRILK